jgi:hypothetical protein
MGRNVADTEVRGNIRWHRKTKSELLVIIYLIRVTCCITVEAHRRHQTQQTQLWLYTVLEVSCNYR